MSGSVGHGRPGRCRYQDQGSTGVRLWLWLERGTVMLGRPTQKNVAHGAAGVLAAGMQAQWRCSGASDLQLHGEAKGTATSGVR